MWQQKSCFYKQRHEVHLKVEYIVLKPDAHSADFVQNALKLTLRSIYRSNNFLGTLALAMRGGKWNWMRGKRMAGEKRRRWNRREGKGRGGGPWLCFAGGRHFTSQVAFGSLLAKAIEKLDRLSHVTYSYKATKHFPFSWKRRPKWTIDCFE